MQSNLHLSFSFLDWINYLIEVVMIRVYYLIRFMVIQTYIHLFSLKHNAKN